MDYTPVFIHAWWRSSSTYVWSKLRKDDSLCCYYEPLNERIAKLDKDSADALLSVEDSARLKHPSQGRSYFAEYFEFAAASVRAYQPEFAYDRYLLRQGDEHPALQSYLRGLLTSAAEAGRRPVLSFCRSQMRSAWIKQQFGGLHVAQIRNPVSQWQSFQVDPYFVLKMMLIGLNLWSDCPQAFAHIPGFVRHGAAVREGSEFARSKFTLGWDDAQRLFLLLWLASCIQSVAQADFVLDVDRLAIDPGYRQTTSEWLASVGCRAEFSDCSTPGARGLPRDEALQAAIDEAICAIRLHAACLLHADAKAVLHRLSQLTSVTATILERAAST